MKLPKLPNIQIVGEVSESVSQSVWVAEQYPAAGFLGAKKLSVREKMAFF